MKLKLVKADMNAKLCFVKDGLAYFTTKELDAQWGDDWDDRPYEHNASPPYDCEIMAYVIGFNEPCGKYFNSPFSVQDINAGAVAWLESDGYSKEPKIFINAGTTLKEFVKKVHQGGGQVFFEVEGND